MNKSFLDRDGDGDFDLADVFRIALPLLGYGLAIAGMIVTATVSWHLLSSKQFNPLFGTWLSWIWPLIVAGMSEFGMALSWISIEVGIRKGKMAKRDWSMAVMIIIGLVGFALFSVLIATMQLYDRELLAGKDLSEVAGWGHAIASVLPLFTIAYAIIVNSAYAALERREKDMRVESRWTVQQPRPQLRQPEPDNYGEPLTDPLSQSVGGRRVRPNPKGHPQHQTATKTALEALNSIRSVGSNGRGEEREESNFT